MSLRRRVETIRRATIRARPHQGLRVALADILVPEPIGDAARRLLALQGAYRERLNRESARLFPALDRWSYDLSRVPWPPAGAPDDDDDAAWEADAWHLLPVPEPGPVVLQEAERAVRAASTPPADELERDVLIVCAYVGHVALNLTRSMQDLEAEAARRRVWDRDEPLR
jgi:hypothetical protein